jgi:hypothetical protein
MTRGMAYNAPHWKKQKYWQKVASDSGIYLTWLRLLNTESLSAEYAWMQLSVFDLSELGLGLLYSILPSEYQPYSISFEYTMPSQSELEQGIWVNFKPIDFSRLYTWMTDFREYIIENFKEQFQPDLLIQRPEKAVYGVTPYARGVYDPVVAREFLRATFHKLRLIRTPDQSWLKMMGQISDYLDMVGVTDEHVFNRIMMLFSAQTQSFVLGLSLLGRSYLSTMDGDLAVIPFMDAKGNIYDLKFRTLDHLQLGWILGVTPLGYGLLLPKESIYKLPDDWRNPTVIKVMVDKIRGIIDRYTMTTWGWSNYNKPEEMRDYHKSEKTNQYDLLQTQRRFVEDWVYNSIPSNESNAVRIRQYQNAVLQAISYRAKRHKWGFESWKSMTEEQFKQWWLNYWSSQGLSIDTLNNLYSGMRRWLKHLQDVKQELGQKIQRSRRRLALSV